MYNYEIIDAHCHVYPEKIARKAAENIGVFYGYPVPEFDGGEPGTIEAHLYQGRKLNFKGYCVSGAATSAKQVISVNDGLIALTKLDIPETIYAFGTAHPDFPNNGDELQRIKSLGLKGIKLHPDCQRFNIDDRSAYSIYDAAQELHLPILMHLGDETHDYSSPPRLLNILRDFPRIRIVAAHLGGYREWDAGLNLAGSKNLWFDTSSSQSILPQERVRSQIRTFGAERCFFGTDFPLWKAEGELKAFLDVGLTHEENEKILAKNFKEFISEE
ncbi:MAG: amidohydrolase family protein [Oscillospiraceae bacterium]|jgi:predicted TIM-barrel fold metal-dependent hydrolase|nr:amidohydrolase family protein [Oscillospiraceae bacterium]